MIDQTKSMKRITLDEVTGEYNQQAEQIAVQVEPMSRAVLRNDTTSSKLVKNPLVNNSRISSIITSYQTQKPSYLTRLYPATPSEEVDISSNNVVVPKEPVETLETGEYSYSRVLQETTHHTTNQTMNMNAIIPVKPIGEYTEQIRVMEKPSSGIDNSSSTEPFSK
ncbi:hypothetical protein WA026_004981 [Henosepilachna vigintioctopunctata]|uniref:Uncharacterized protein n=1 Tax=Henosepilachna vigintioctopunctata TaxID=420089 RepID=A0AAW1UTC6_9CUCU